VGELGPWGGRQKQMEMPMFLFAPVAVVIELGAAFGVDHVVLRVVVVGEHAVAAGEGSDHGAMGAGESQPVAEAAAGGAIAASPMAPSPHQ